MARRKAKTGRAPNPQIERLMLVSEYRWTRFQGNKKPHQKTLIRWINEGTLPGLKIGGRYYVNVSSEEHWWVVSGDPLMDRRIRRILGELGPDDDD